MPGLNRKRCRFIRRAIELLKEFVEADGDEEALRRFEEHILSGGKILKRGGRIGREIRQILITARGDFSYFEPDPELRAEHPALWDEQQAVEEALEVLARLADLFPSR